MADCGCDFVDTGAGSGGGDAAAYGGGGFVDDDCSYVGDDNKH
jgi:hypothetical protein